MKTSTAPTKNIAQSQMVTKKKMREILQPRDTIYVVYGNWGSKKKK